MSSGTVEIATPRNESLGVRVSEAAEILDCGKSTVYSLVNSGQLRTYNVSGSVSGRRGLRIVRQSIHDFVERGGVVFSTVGAGVTIESGSSGGNFHHSGPKWA